jgi:hypothetical protein
VLVIRQRLNVLLIWLQKQLQQMTNLKGGKLL